MRSITIKVEDDMYEQIERLRTLSFYSKTEFVRDALRQRILSEKLQHIQKLEGSHSSVTLTRQDKVEAFDEFAKLKGWKFEEK